MKEGIDDINWDQIKLVIFDVDGTLYDQKRLRFKMLLELIKYYLVRPWKYKELNTLRAFRKNREILAHSDASDIRHKQYIVPGHSDKADSGAVKEIVDRWIRQIPLAHVHKYTFPGIKKLILSFGSKGIAVAILSDYHPTEKLKVMGIDTLYNYSSESPEINILKPNPRGINHILKQLAVSKETTLYIGDRYDTDGMAAKRADVLFLKIDRKTAAKAYSYIYEKILHAG